MKFHASAIFLGTLADLALSFIFGPIILYTVGIYGSNPFLPHWSLVLGLIAVAIGGYVTAWKSPSEKVFNGFIFGAIQILIGILGAIFITMPLWFNIASFVLIIPTALLGVYIAMRGK